MYSYMTEYVYEASCSPPNMSMGNIALQTAMSEICHVGFSFFFSLNKGTCTILITWPVNMPVNV